MIDWTNIFTHFVYASGLFLIGFVLYYLLMLIPEMRKNRISLLLLLFISGIRIFLSLCKVDDLAFIKYINALLWFLFFWILMQLTDNILIDKLLVRKGINVPLFIKDIAKLIAIIIVILIIMKGILGEQISTTSAILSAVVGFALQDVLGNLIAGIALNMEHPFKPGDWIKIDEHWGKVIGTSWRATRILNIDNDYIIVPNGNIASSEIINYSRPSILHLHRLTIGVNYDIPPNKVKNVLLEILNDIDGVLKKPNPRILLSNYGDFAITYDIRFWINDYGKHIIICDDIMSRIWYYFKRNDIVIPFPIRNITVQHISEEIETLQKENKYKQIVEMLKNADILKPLNYEEKYKLVSHSPIAFFSKDEILVKQGEKGDSFYLILDGEVEIYFEHPTENRIIHLDTLKQGNFFGETSLLTGEKRGATVKALEDTQVLVINHDNFKQILQNNPNIAEELSIIIHERAIQKYEESISKTTSIKTIKRDKGTLLNKIKNFFGL